MKIKRFIGFFILIFWPIELCYSSQRYAVILSGGSTLEDNHYHFYNSTVEVFSALRKGGLKRDNIFTLYADGGAPGIDTVKTDPWTFHLTKSYMDTPVSLEGDDHRDIKQPATREGINTVFDELVKKVKPGDNIFFFIANHGHKNKGIILWNEQSYSVSDVEQQLAKLPSDVTVQIATYMCYGGQLLRLTKKNICVVTNSDDKKVAYGRLNVNPFAVGLANAIKNGSQATGVRFVDAFQSAKENDLSDNTTHLTSIDYFIENQNLNVPVQDNLNDSCQNLSPIEKLQKEISQIIKILNKANDKRKLYYESYLSHRIVELTQNLDSLRNRYSNWVRSSYQARLDELKSQWSSLSDQEHQRLRPYYTDLVEKLREEDQNQRKKLEDLKEDHRRALAELRFLIYASPSQLEDYYNIRRCLEHEI